MNTTPRQAGPRRWIDVTGRPVDPFEMTLHLGASSYRSLLPDGGRVGEITLLHRQLSPIAHHGPYIYRRGDGSFLVADSLEGPVQFAERVDAALAEVLGLVLVDG